MNNKGNKKSKNEKESKISSFISFLKHAILISLFGLVTTWYVKDMPWVKSHLTVEMPDFPYPNKELWWGDYPINMDVDESIRQFNIEFSDVMINDLRERLLHRREFTPPLEDAGFTYGFNSKFLTQVLDYWQNKYNFKEREEYLNKYNHYTTIIHGLDIHFMQVKPQDTTGVEVVPLLMLHGWPGSFCEFYNIIPQLTTPRSGYKFVFEVIVPSLPGFGYSQGAARPGLDSVHIGIMMHELMLRLGHKQFYVQAGDIGHVIGSGMATLFPRSILGYHTNFPVLLFSKYAAFYTALGSLWPSWMVEPELESRMYPLNYHVNRLFEETGYLHIQATKPDTVGIGLSDSPAGLAAYILEKFSTWTNPDNKKASDGNLLSSFVLTQLLDNVMIYWATNSVTTSMRVQAEILSSEITQLLDDVNAQPPTWGIKFKHELLYQPDSILQMKYNNYLHSTVVEDGGHFAAMELPDIMADDIFYAVATFIDFRSGKTKKTEQVSEPEPKTVYEFTVKDLNGRDVKLEKYRGLVLLIVNVASQCGLTDTNYKQLNELHEKYYDRDLRILAFPCNQFGGQEPGDAKEIFSFTKQRGVKFDVFEKIEVNGENAHPLWKFLKRTQSGTLGDFIKWNFSKFIIDRNGIPVERLAPNVSPLDLEPYLANYW